MDTIRLDTLIHTEWDGKSPLRLYLYNAEGFHRGGKWFQDVPQYPDEEITTAAALQLIAEAIANKQEVRVCDGSDFLVFHSVHGLILHDGGFTEMAK